MDKSSPTPARASSPREPAPCCRCNHRLCGEEKTTKALIRGARLGASAPTMAEDEFPTRCPSRDAHSHCSAAGSTVPGAGWRLPPVKGPAPVFSRTPSSRWPPTWHRSVLHPLYSLHPRELQTKLLAAPGTPCPDHTQKSLLRSQGAWTGTGGVSRLCV